MKNKEEAIKLITKKLNNDTYLTYDEISTITGYHTKYLFKIKKDIIDGTISLEHGNKNRKPINAITDIEKEKIKTLFGRSTASIRKFSKFYNKRSYSCIYNIINEEKKTEE